jgi:acetylornithine deacetylase
LNRPSLGFNLVLDDGGCKPNVTAAKTVCTISLRPMPNDRSGDVIAHIADRARHHGLAVSTKLYPPYSVPAEATVVRAALAVTGAAKAQTVPFGTEATFYQEALELVILGPGDIGQAHTNGEWIALSQLHEAVDVYARLIDHLCT